jgi:hypothetical protein
VAVVPVAEPALVTLDPLRALAPSPADLDRLDLDRAQRVAAAGLVGEVVRPLVGIPGAWVRQAACAGLSPEVVEVPACERCPVLAACLGAALAEEQRAGASYAWFVRGGTSAHARVRLRRWGEALGASTPEHWAQVAEWWASGDLDAEALGAQPSRAASNAEAAARASACSQ